MCHYKKIIILTFLLSSGLFGENFEKNCLECHFATEQLKMFLQRYEEKYGSEKEVKKAIFEYLKNPKKENSIMPNGFLRRFGVKEKSTLSDKVLKDEIDGYYKNYSLKNKLR
ncbi:MAG TPA: hypothetical protein CFH84_09230 [Sulfurimonas sp. UBA12504]|nr:MAG TPA: hypothetical protein CFH84_09230 [Sulfurimonas sp. UBA12504]